MRLNELLFTAVMILFLAPHDLKAQVKIDIDWDVARKAAGTTTVDDLSVHDTAYLFQQVCIKDGGLFVPGWSSPIDLAGMSYDASGIFLKVELLPGRRLKGTFVDAAQAQRKAKGLSDKPVLTKSDFDAAIRKWISANFEGGFGFGIVRCDDEMSTNPLRKLNLYSLDSLNGFTSVSQLLGSVTESEKKLGR